MTRASKTGLVLFSLLALTATASAEPTGPGNNNGGSQRLTARQYEQWQLKRDFYQKVAQKFHKPKPIPIDPGRGDGKPLESAHQPPQGPPGFNWVNGHWERVKAPVGPTVVVRDHRTVTPGTVVVRDHRTVAPNGGWQVRPQDASSSSGGVTVTESPRLPIKVQGVQVRDHRGR